MSREVIPQIVTPEEWERSRAELLIRRKTHTRSGDELAAARQRLSVTQMEPVSVGDSFGPAPLQDVGPVRRPAFVDHKLLHVE